MKPLFLAASIAGLAALSGCVGYGGGYYGNGYGYGYGYNGYASPGYDGNSGYSRGYRDRDRDRDHRNDAWRRDSQWDRDRGDRPSRNGTPDDYRY